MDSKIALYQQTHDEAYFNEHLLQPIIKLIEIVSALHVGSKSISDLTDLRQECLTFIHSIIHKYDATLGFKSYSFFTYCIKNWFSAKNIRLGKYQDNTISLEISMIDDTEEHKMDVPVSVNKWKLEQQHDDVKSFYYMFLEEFKRFSENRLNYSGAKPIVRTISEILLSGDFDYDSTQKNNIFDKLKETYPNINKKQISNAMRYVRSAYKIAKQQYIKTGTINLLKHNMVIGHWPEGT